MTLRLVLVSLVAALGLTIPGTSMIESWVASTQNWMNARFADWDTRNPPSADYVIVSDYYDSTRCSSRSDSTRVPELNVVSENLAAQNTRSFPSPLRVSSSSAVALGDGRFSPVRRVSLTSKRIDFRPIDITAGWHRGIALELNRRHEGIGFGAPREVALTAVSSRFKPLSILEPVRTVGDELNRQHEGTGILPPEQLGPKVVSRSRFEPIPVSDQLEAGIAFELNRSSEGLRIRDVTTAMPTKAGRSNSTSDTEATSLSFGLLELEPNLYFADALVEPTGKVANQRATGLQPASQQDTSFAPTAIVSSESQNSRSTLVAPASLAVDERSESLDELEIEVAGELATSEDGFGHVRPRSLWLTNRLEAEAQMKPFDPRVADDLSIIVEELKWQNDGLDLSSTTASTRAPALASSSRPSRSLSRAVELTRDAVYAWVNVLTGPAVVTVTSSR